MGANRREALKHLTMAAVGTLLAARPRPAEAVPELFPYKPAKLWINEQTGEDILRGGYSAVEWVPSGEGFAVQVIPVPSPDQFFHNKFYVTRLSLAELAGGLQTTIKIEVGRFNFDPTKVFLSAIPNGVPSKDNPPAFYAVVEAAHSYADRRLYLVPETGNNVPFTTLHERNTAQFVGLHPEMSVLKTVKTLTTQDSSGPRLPPDELITLSLKTGDTHQIDLNRITNPQMAHLNIAGLLHPTKPLDSQLVIHDTSTHISASNIFFTAVDVQGRLQIAETYDIRADYSLQMKTAGNLLTGMHRDPEDGTYHLFATSLDSDGHHTDLPRLRIVCDRPQLLGGASLSDGQIAYYLRTWDRQEQSVWKVSALPDGNIQTELAFRDQYGFATDKEQVVSQPKRNMLPHLVTFVGDVFDPNRRLKVWTPANWDKVHFPYQSR